MKDQLVFDVTSAATIADSDQVGAYLLAGTDGDQISSGDGDSDNVANTFEGIDARSFMFGYDGTGDNWDRIRQTSGAMHVFIDDGDFEVDVVINAEKAEDAAHSSGDTGNYVLAVRQDTLAASTDADGDYASFKVDSVGSLYVKATDSDALLTTIDADTSILSDAIKNEDDAASSGDAGFPGLAVRQDTLASSTSADGDYGHMKQNAAGELYVTDEAAEALLTTIDADTGSIDSTLSALSKSEDAAHSSGDQGIQALAVRNDTLASLVDADGDYAPLQVSAAGALYVNIAEGTLSVNDAALANTSIANAANTLAVASTAEDAVASPLASRKYLWLYNNSNRRMYVGASGVTESNGFPIAPRSYLEMRAGASIDIEFVGPAAGQELRSLELS